MKRLRISFITSDGRTRTYSIPDPVDTITPEDAQTLMNLMLGAFVPSDWIIDRAAVVDTNTNELFDLV